MDELLPTNVVLSGFRDVDKASMSAVAKVVSNYAKKIEERCKNMERLSILMKPVHENEKTSKFEIHGKLLDNGKAFTAEMTDKDLLFAIEKVLGKIESEMKH